MSAQAANRFETVRPMLLRHAYRMLGQYGDAEDVVQDAFLRWSEALERREVHDDPAFLRTTVTHLCLDRIRSARAKREVYAGQWLPEPVVSNDAENPEDAAALADDVSFALLLALERLAPLERAAFLLHDALDVTFAEVAQTLGRSEPAVRKLASRAREHVRDASRHGAIARADAERLRDALMDALSNDDPVALSNLLTDDVVFTSDGGGKAPAPVAPVLGRERVSTLLVGLKRKGAERIRRIETVTLNGLPGIVLFDRSGVDTAMAMEVTGGQISAFYVMRNPDKLRAVAAQVPGGD